MKVLFIYSCTFSVIECQDKRLDLCILADRSESLSNDDINKLTTFIITLINRLDIDSGNTRVAYIRYNHDRHVVFHLNTYTDRLSMISAIQTPLNSQGGTNTHLALQAMRHEIFTIANGHRPGAQKVGLIITDGESTFPDWTTIQAEASKSDGIHLIAVGVDMVTSSGGQLELNAIASEPKDRNVFNVNGYGELNQLYQQLVDQFGDCQRELFAIKN